MLKRTFWTINRRVGASLLALVVLSLTICAGGVGAMWMVRRALAPIPTEYLTEVKLSASIQRDLLGATP